MRLKRLMNRAASQAYKFCTVTDHALHEEYLRVRIEYGDAITRAKESHWKKFLEEIEGTELWTAHRYVVNPVGDGGKARILMLQVTEVGGTTRSLI